MNFLQAQNVHVLWKVRLEKYLETADQEHAGFEHDTAGDNTLCELGIWLNDNKEKFSESEHFEPLEKQHEEFHKLVADVIDLIDHDQKTQAMELIKGQYKEVSHKLKISLSKLAKDIDYTI